jgi:hypothetical protein
MHLDRLIGVHDDRDEDAEHHVYEEADEDVEVQAAVPPDVRTRVLDRGKSDVQFISID